MLRLDEPDLDEVLLDRLAGLDEAGLARVLANRPDALNPPWPRRLEDLVRRLSSPESIVLAMRGLTKPGFQAMRAIRLLNQLRGEGGFDIDEMAAWLGSTVEEVKPSLDALADRGLAWHDGTRLRTPPSHDVIEVDFAGLGTSIAEYLSQQTVQQLKTMSAALGVSVDGRKGQIVDRMLEFFRDRNRVAELMTGAPDGTEELLTEFAWNGPERECYLGSAHYGYGRHPEPESPARWAATRGLLWADHYGAATMPLEVGLALRGPDYRLPFVPQPPFPVTYRVSAEQVRAESSAAALRLVDRICAVLDYAATQPIPLLKSGRVGARAIKTLAKDTSSTVDEARLAVELAIRMRLLAPVDVEPAPAATRSKRGSRPPRPEPLAELAPSDRWAAWRDAGSAERLCSALRAWWTLPLAPLGDEKALRSVLGDQPTAAYTDLRQLTVGLPTRLPEGTGISDDGSLAALAAWHSPLINPDLVDPLVAASLAEAALLGVTGAGAAGELARALVDGTQGRPGSSDREETGLVRAAEQLVAEARTTALFGADLTAVVTGPPDAELAGLLDRAADRETTGAASTWRFSPASVRRAFDSGATAEALLHELRSVAQKPLPQPLEYLINDVERRHGEVGVLDVGCVVVGDGPALLAEIAAHRRLSALNLRPVAPTVLVATGSAEATIAALRAAGYLPALRSADGTVVVQEIDATRSRSSAPAELTDPSPRPAQDPREHAARLLSAPTRSDGRRIRRGTLNDVLFRAQGERLTPKWMEFIWQMEAGLPARVEYVEPDGDRLDLVISDVELHGDAIDVWCRRTARYRRLELARVTPMSNFDYSSGVHEPAGAP